MKRHRGGFRMRRPRPTAENLPYPPGSTGLVKSLAREGRTVLLRTGRGEVRLTAAEARDLAAELLQSAEAAEAAGGKAVTA